MFLETKLGDSFPTRALLHVHTHCDKLTMHVDDLKRYILALKACYLDEDVDEECMDEEQKLELSMARLYGKVTNTLDWDTRDIEIQYNGAVVHDSLKSAGFNVNEDFPVVIVHDSTSDLGCKQFLRDHMTVRDHMTEEQVMMLNRIWVRLLSLSMPPQTGVTIMGIEAALRSGDHSQQTHPEYFEDIENEAKVFMRTWKNIGMLETMDDDIQLSNEEFLHFFQDMSNGCTSHTNDDSVCKDINIVIKALAASFGVLIEDTFEQARQHVILDSRKQI